MVEVNEKLTREVAKLARLELAPEEVQAFTAQLKEVLGYVEQLEQVDVTGVEPLLHPFEGETPLRADEVRPSPVDSEGNPKVAASAPEAWDGGFKVPQII